MLFAFVLALPCKGRKNTFRNAEGTVHDDAPAAAAAVAAVAEAEGEEAILWWTLLPLMTIWMRWGRTAAARDMMYS